MKLNTMEGKWRWLNTNLSIFVRVLKIFILKYFLSQDI